MFSEHNPLIMLKIMVSIFLLLLFLNDNYFVRLSAGEREGFLSEGCCHAKANLAWAIFKFCAEFNLVRI